MTAPITVPPAALARAEEIVSKFAHGRMPQTSLYFHFFGQCCPQLPPDIEDAFEDAATAFREWAKATPTDGHWMTPVARRALLDDALVALVAALDAATTTEPRTEAA